MSGMQMQELLLPSVQNQRNGSRSANYLGDVSLDEVRVEVVAPDFHNVYLFLCWVLVALAATDMVEADRAKEAARKTARNDGLRLEIASV